MTTITIDRAVVEQALGALESSRVFVTSREKIKHPEGTEWYDERIAALRAALAQQAEPVERAMQDAVTTGMGIMRGGERIDPSTIYKPIEGVPV